MKMKKSIMLIAFMPVFLSACGHKVEFTPDNGMLKNAKIGESYLFKVTVFGGPVMGGKKRVPGFVTPDDAGIFMRNCSFSVSQNLSEPIKAKNYNCIEIYGTPTKPGLIKINIGGAMYGNMFGSGSKYSKDYILNVVTP